MKKYLAIVLIMILILTISSCSTVDYSSESTAKIINTPNLDVETQSPTYEIENTVSEPIELSYEIKNTFYDKLLGNDGVVVIRHEYWQPVFDETSEIAKKINQVFKSEIDDIEFTYGSYLELESYNNGDTYEYREIWGPGGSLVKYSLKYSDKGVYSFLSYKEVYDFGTVYMFNWGRTFDKYTGKELKITDVLKLTEDNIADVLYAEHIVYIEEFYIKEGFSWYEREITSDGYKKHIIDNSGVNAIFWLEEDGVHIFYPERDAAGFPSEIVIPYSRTDLVKEAFQ